MGRSDLKNIFNIGLIYIFFNGMLGLIQNQLRWELKSLEYSWVSIVLSFLTSAASIWLAYIENLGLEGLLWGMIIGCSSASVLGFWYLRNSYRLKFDFKLLSEMLRFSVPLVPSGIAVWLSIYVDRVMINNFLSLHEVGLYGIGFRVAGIVSIVLAGFQSSLSPLVFNNLENIETPYNLSRIFRFFLAISLLLFGGIVFFVDDILRIFTEPTFYDSSKVVIYLVPAILLSQMYIFTPGIFIAKKTHYVIWINVFGAILNISLNYVLIPILGYAGAALSTFLGNLSIFLIYLFFSQKLYPVPHQFSKIFKSLIWVISWILLIRYIDISGAVHYFLMTFGLLLILLGIIFFELIKRDELIFVYRKIKSLILV
jgi:O-antigen/teichoic acid export membrane protein